MRSDSDDGTGDPADNGTQLRQRMGLTATVDSGSSRVPLPDPYAETCLDETCCADDSLTQLAKATFRKLSAKVGTSKRRKWKPTPVQLQAWPMLRSRRGAQFSPEAPPPKLIAIATTGSGKTLSYALPMVDSCAAARGETPPRGVHGLVLVPTRELALQVSKVLKTVAKAAHKLRGEADRIVALAIYGGVNREEQLASLGKEARFLLAATPARLLDLLGLGANDGDGTPDRPDERARHLFQSTQYVVLDEADQMAASGELSRQVDRILEFVRAPSRPMQECLFSATLPRRVLAKCHEWMACPRVTIKVDTVTVGDTAKSDLTGGSTAVEDANTTVDRAGLVDLSTIPSHITQILHVCSQHKKPKKLLTTIQKIRNDEKARGNNRRKGLLVVFFGRIKTLQCVFLLLH